MSKRHIRSPQKAALRCQMCSKTNQRAIRIQTCAGCSLVYYCSVQCERKDWPKHRVICFDYTDGKVADMLKAALAHDDICTLLLLAVIQACSLSLERLLNRQDPSVREPRYLRVDIGVEPSDNAEMARACDRSEKWNHRGVEGMLQLHDMTPIQDDPEDPVLQPSQNLDEKMREAWIQCRKSFDKKGMDTTPVVMVVFVVGAAEMEIGHPMGIPDQLLNYLVLRGQVEGIENVNYDFLNEINELIRADTKNEFKMRGTMSKRDRRHIRRAVAGTEGLAYEALRRKMLREPIYKTRPGDSAPTPQVSIWEWLTRH